MSELPKLPNFVASSKSDIWNALKETRAKLEELSGGVTLQTTTATAEKTKITTAKTIAAEVKPDDLTAFVTTIVDLKSQYDALIIAVSDKKLELKSILDIEIESNSLITLVAAKDQLITEKTNTANKILEDAQTRADAIITDAEKRAATVREANLIFERDLHTSRKREADEYAYNFARQKKSDLDKRNDEVAVIDKALNLRIEAVEAREATIECLDGEIAALKAQIATLIASTDIKIATAVDEAKKSANTSAAISKAMDSKGHEADIRIKDAKIETLEARVTDLMTQLTTASTHVSDANNRISEMARGALAASANADTIAKFTEITSNKSNR